MPGGGERQQHAACAAEGQEEDGGDEDARERQQGAHVPRHQPADLHRDGTQAGEVELDPLGLQGALQLLEPRHQRRGRDAGPQLQVERDRPQVGAPVRMDLREQGVGTAQFLRRGGVVGIHQIRRHERPRRDVVGRGPDHRGAQRRRIAAHALQGADERVHPGDDAQVRLVQSVAVARRQIHGYGDDVVSLGWQARLVPRCERPFRTAVGNRPPEGERYRQGRRAQRHENPRTEPEANHPEIVVPPEASVVASEAVGLARERQSDSLRSGRRGWAKKAEPEATVSWGASRSGRVSPPGRARWDPRRSSARPPARWRADSACRRRRARGRCGCPRRSAWCAW